MEVITDKKGFDVEGEERERSRKHAKKSKELRSKRETVGDSSTRRAEEKAPPV
jgi:hypothetical protein